MITDVFMILGSVGGLGVIAWIGRRVYLAELGRRCGWCFGTGREWGEEYAARCPACAGTGVVRAAASVLPESTSAGLPEHRPRLVTAPGKALPPASL